MMSEMDRTAESSYKNRVYCILCNVMDFADIWMDKSEVSQHTTQVSVNIK